MANKIKLSRHPYIGSSIKRPKKVIRKLKQGRKQLKVFLLVLSGDNYQLEIYHNIILQQWYYRENPPLIIGIAGNHGEALDLVCQITEEAIEKLGRADLKGYLKDRERKEKERAERFHIRQ